MPDNKTPLVTNEARDASTFQPFATFPWFAEAQLDSWLSAVKIQAVSALEWKWPKHWVVGPRVVKDSMFFWVERGSGKAWFGDPTNVVHFGPGDLLLIPQDMKHEVEGMSDEEPHVYAVHFYATLFGGVDLLSMLGFPVHLPARRGTPYKQACEQMARDFAVKAPGWGPLMSHEIYRVLVYMLRADTERFHPVHSVDSHAELPRLLPALNWIATHLSSHEITVGELSKKVYLSETHFRRLFHKVIGTSPVQFIRQQRVDRACALLRTTDMPIKQISQHCGFADDAFFSRVFHRLVGTSPAAYRRLVVV